MVGLYFSSSADVFKFSIRTIQTIQIDSSTHFFVEDVMPKPRNRIESTIFQPSDSTNSTHVFLKMCEQEFTLFILITVITNAIYLILAKLLIAYTYLQTNQARIFCLYPAELLCILLCLLVPQILMF